MRYTLPRYVPDTPHSTPAQPGVRYVCADPSTAGLVDESIALRTVSSRAQPLETPAERDADCIVCHHAPEAGVDGPGLFATIRERYPDRPVVLCTDDPDGADDGPGIPDHDLAVVTGEDPITQLSHGSGLGLWLVIWVVESYGGRVRFSDDGTAVTLSMPRRYSNNRTDLHTDRTAVVRSDVR